VHDEGESITIPKRGRTVARLVPAGPADNDERPWLRVRGTLRKYDPFAPAVDGRDIDALS
jgi:antitoxin (DNA-binding transcriptional repressor) of toxin-antitoxin stability system